MGKKGACGKIITKLDTAGVVQQAASQQQQHACVKHLRMQRTIIPQPHVVQAGRRPLLSVYTHRQASATFYFTAPRRRAAACCTIALGLYGKTVAAEGLAGTCSRRFVSRYCRYCLVVPSAHLRQVCAGVKLRYVNLYSAEWRKQSRYSHRY